MKEEVGEKVFEDNFDLLAEVLKIKAKGTLMNEEFKLSDLSNAEKEFILKQLKLIKVIHGFVKDEEERDKLINYLLQEINHMVIMSQAKNGRILKAVLTTGTAVETEEEESKTGLKDIILAKK